MEPCTGTHTNHQETWRAFMTDVEALANRHPYVIKPGAGRAAGWAGCLAVGAVLGFCCINPDGGDYSVWIPEVQQVLERWRPTFQQRGCALSFVHQRYVLAGRTSSAAATGCMRVFCEYTSSHTSTTLHTHRNSYIQIDVDPNAPVQFKKA